MAKLEEMLKAQGWTDADIAASSTLLQDQRFRQSIENFHAQQETVWTEENTRWADWAEKTNQPQLEALNRQVANLSADVAAREARLNLARAAGYTAVAGDPPPNPEPQNRQQQNAFAPEEFDKRYVSKEEAARLASMQGDAIAMANDLAMEYQHLTGKSLIDYATTDATGRPLRGMSALLHESRSQRQVLPDYIANKFNFAGLRAQKAEAAKVAEQEAIRQDERQKMAAQYGNPNTRPLAPSNFTFIPTARKDDGGKQPWEIPAGERRNHRLQRAMETQVKSGSMVQ